MFTKTQLQRIRVVIERYIKANHYKTGTMYNSLWIEQVGSTVAFGFGVNYIAYLDRLTGVMDTLQKLVEKEIMSWKSSEKLKEIRQDINSTVKFEIPKPRISTDQNGKKIYTYPGRRAVDNPTPLLNPRDITTPQGVKDAYKNSINKWDDYRNVVTRINNQGKPEHKNSLTLATVQMINDQNKYESLGINVVPPTMSNTMNSTNLSKGEFRLYMKDMRTFLKSRPRFKNALAQGTVNMFVNPQAAIEYQEKIYNQEIADYEKRVKDWYAGKGGKRPKTSKHIKLAYKITNKGAVMR